MTKILLEHGDTIARGALFAISAALFVCCLAALHVPRRRDRGGFR